MSEEQANHAEPTPHWPALTKILTKQQLYQTETYFREGFRDAHRCLGSNLSLVIRRGALLLVKPDGLRAGKTRTIIEFLAANDWSLVAVEWLRLTRLSWRELWRYQLGAASSDRLTVNDLILRNSVLLLGLRDTTSAGIPATVRLSSLKGPSDVAAQPPGCLRRLLGQSNRLFSSFHVADEPADLFRELSILLDSPARQRFFCRLASGEATAEERRFVDAVCAREPRSLDARLARERVEAAVRASTGPGRERSLEILCRAERGERIDWELFSAALGACDAKVKRWDLATLGATFIAYDLVGVPKLVPPIDPSLWHHADEHVSKK